MNKCKPGEELVHLWQAQKTSSGVRYQISLQHPVIQQCPFQAGELSPQIQAMLRLIEETVPVQQIWLDTAETKRRRGQALKPRRPQRCYPYCRSCTRPWLVSRRCHRRWRNSICKNMEPFDNYPELIAQLPTINKRNRYESESPDDATECIADCANAPARPG